RDRPGALGVRAAHPAQPPGRRGGLHPGRAGRRAAADRAGAARPAAGGDQHAGRDRPGGRPTGVRPRAGALAGPGRAGPAGGGARRGGGVGSENEVKVVAMAEYDHGAARGATAFALLWVDEGIGLAYVQNGVPHRGATGGAGEVGYMPVPGQPVFRDVRETGDGGYQYLAGGPAVRQLLRGHGFPARDGAGAVTKAVAALAAPAGRTARAAAALGELAGRLATGLAAVTAVLDPGLIVLAGGVLQAGGEPLRSRLEAELHTIAIGRPRLKLCSAEGNPMLLGALNLALSA